MSLDYTQRSGRHGPALSRRWLLGLCFILLVVSACKETSTPSPTPAPPASPTPTQAAEILTPTPTPAPLGSAANPLQMGVVASLDDTQVVMNVDLLADELSRSTGISIQGWIMPTYDELLLAIDQRMVHFAWLPPFTYIVSHNRGVADVALVSNHFGVTGYGFQILAHAESPFVSYFDPLTNESIGDAQSALPQFQDRRPCWVDPQSASGYVAPLGAFSQLGVTLQQAVITLDPGSTIRTLYVKGVCDFGATYATFGDPRTAASILEELPDVMGKVIVIWQSDPVIPNLNLTVSTDLPANMRQMVIGGLIEFIKTEEGKTVISAANSYEIEDLEIVDDSIYDALRGYVEASGIPLRSLIGK